MLLLDPSDPLSEVITLQQAARAVGRPDATVRDWVRRDLLRTIRIPGQRRVWTTARWIRETEADLWERRFRP